MSAELQTSAERFCVDPSAENRQAVAVASLPLVRSLARRVTLPDHPLATRSDLESAGILGMLQALDSYDASRGTSFASFAYARISGAFVDFVRSIDLLSRDRRRRVARAQNVADKMQQQLGYEPHTREVAAALELSIEDYHNLLADAQSRFTISLHNEHDSNNTQSSAPIDVLRHPDPESEIEALERESLFGYVQKLMYLLPEREQQIINRYYFKDQTLREIGVELSLTEARISQILSRVLLTLRGQLIAARAAA